MIRQLTFVFVLASTAVSAEPRRDQHGDPLPEGAIARFGSERFRIGAALNVPSWALSHDGKSIAVECASGVTLWDIDSGRIRLTLHSRRQGDFLFEEHLCLSTDGKHLVRSASEHLEIWDLQAANLLHEIKLEHPSGFVTFIPNTSRFIVSAGGYPMLTFDAATGKQVESLDVERFVWSRSPDGKWLFGDVDEQMHLLDAKTGRIKIEFEKLAGSVQAHQWSKDGKEIYIAKVDGTVSSFDLRTGRKLGQVPAPKGWDADRGRRVTLSLSPDGDVLYMSTPRQIVFRIDLSAKKWLEPIPLAGRAIPLSDSKRGVVLCSDGFLRQVDLKTLKESPIAPGFDAAPQISPSLDGKYFAQYSSEDGIAMVNEAGKCLWRRADYLARAVHWVPNRREFLCVEGKRITLCDPATGKAVQIWETEEDHSYSPEIGIRPESGEFIVPAGQGFRIDTFSLTKKSIVGSLRTEEFGDVIASSPNGRFLLSESEETLKILNLKTHKSVEEKKPKLDNSAFRLTRSAFAPDESFLLTWEPEGVAVMRKPATGVEFKRVSLEIQGYSWCHTFSPNSIWIAVSDRECDVGLWEFPSGQLIRRWTAHRQEVDSVAFAGPGRLLSSSRDMTALLWELRPKEKPSKPLWDALSGEDAKEAFRAVWAIADDLKGAELLRAKIAPARAVSARQVSEWIADLNAEKFAVRDKAAKELQLAGRLVEAELRAARAKAVSGEQESRIDALLAKITPERTRDEIVQARAVAAMEISGSDAARKLLEEWAAGASGARLTSDAAGALGRMTAKK